MEPNPAILWKKSGTGRKASRNEDLALTRLAEP
jgi:hypothetical protein